MDTEKIAKLERQLARAAAEHTRIYGELIEAKAELAKETAARIVRAGKRARGEVDDLPPEGTLARSIVLAGRRARGETE